ncbi:MAG: ATP-binding cassette domain-containing protein [Candidatus Carbobacillus altaicus]|nr:ATP-binding cassette domain-containing protein [Candidatus Carbobacillus altaicus]
MPVFNKDIIHLHEVSVRREGKTLLKRLNWAVKHGERWAVLGTNGAGKSTLLNLLAARLYPSEGTVRLFGQRLGHVDVSHIFPKIGWISPTLEHFFTDTDTPRMIIQSGIKGHIRLPQHLHGTLLLDVDKRALVSGEEERLRLPFFETIVTLTRLDELIERSWGTLSSGEKKRVLLARALLGSPQLFIFDEASSGLDLFAREDWLKLLGTLFQTDDHRTIVYVTHHSEEMTDLFTHVLLIRRGEVFFAGRREEALQETILRAFYERPVRITWQDGRPFIQPVA